MHKMEKRCFAGFDNDKPPVDTETGADGDTDADTDMDTDMDVDTDTDSDADWMNTTDPDIDTEDSTCQAPCGTIF